MASIKRTLTYEEDSRGRGTNRCIAIDVQGLVEILK